MGDLKKLVIYTDGGARGNPGPAAIGVVFYEDDGLGNQKKIGEIKKYIGEQTNNFAEYTALITALEQAAGMGYDLIDCLLDSELVVRQLNGLYKIREETLKPLASRVLVLGNRFKKISYSHIPRAKNHEADKLVNQALDNEVAAKQ